jgi:hypothetical protein
MVRNLAFLGVLFTAVVWAQQPGQPIVIRGQAMAGNGQIVNYASLAPQSSDSGMKLNLGEVEALLIDDTRLRAVMLADTLELQTAYGKLNFPASKILRVEFGIRISETEKKTIAAAIEDTTSTDAKKRVTGRESLLSIGVKALPAVQRAVASGINGEGGAALADVEARLKALLPGGLQTLQDKDRVHVAGSAFSGTLQGDGLKIKTLAFGDQTLNYAHLRSLRTANLSEDDGIPTIPYPGSLGAYIGQTGKVLKFNVTALAQGGVWGTGTYTLDTYLPAAAIHAGVLKPGQTGVVKIKIVPSPQLYTGSTQNGITSAQYPYYPNGAFEILK